MNTIKCTHMVRYYTCDFSCKQQIYHRMEQDDKWKQLSAYPIQDRMIIHFKSYDCFSENSHISDCDCMINENNYQKHRL